MRYENENKKADRLYEEAKDREQEAKRQARKLAAEESRAAAEAERRASEGKKQELQRQRTLEEARDLEVQPGWSEERLKLAADLGTIRKTYEGIVSRVGDAMRRASFGRGSSNYIFDGYILGVLMELSNYMTT